MLEQKGGVVWAGNSDGFISGTYKVEWGQHRDITAEVAFTRFDVLGSEGVHSAIVGIWEIVSDEKGVENFADNKPGAVFRKGVTSVTFYVSSYKGYVEGRWLINFWS